MADDFMQTEDDFILEDEETNEGGSNRQFLTLAGILVITLVLASICTIAYLFINPGGNNTNRVAAIETQNAVIAVTNAAVTETLIADATARAEPTSTPTIPPTNTSAPTNTPLPTDTPVVQEANSEGENTEGENTEGENTEGENSETAEGETETTENGEDGNGTTTDGNSTTDGNNTDSNTTTDGTTNQDATPTPINAATANNNAETLPQTGIETWSAFLIALILIATLVAARRLRTIG